MTPFATLLTVLPVANSEHQRLAEKAAQRNTHLYTHGHNRPRHASTVTGTGYVTVTHILTREDNR